MHGHWWRRPIWWPAATLAIAVLAGLAVLAANPTHGGGEVTYSSAADRLDPIPTVVHDARVDLNRASQAELEALPRIGAATAELIIVERELEPFTSLADAVERGVFSRATAEQLLDLVSALP